ncbi:MAG: glycoside hydrolase family 36 N-terminal domain-containing protein, partial [Pseudomonadota bacterium]
MIDRYICLEADDTSLILDCQIGGRPNIVYWGRRLNNIDPGLLKQLATRQHAPGGTDIDLESSLLNETGTGFAGLSGLSAHRAGRDWASLFIVKNVEQHSEHDATITCHSENSHIEATHTIKINPDSGVVTFETEIANQGKDDLHLDWCTPACLPLAATENRRLGFTGKWANEFQVEEIPEFT